MFTIEMLPADYGDCLWIEYGEEKDRQRVLIDGGTTKTYPRLRERILQLPEKDRRFELFILTHIDADHIGGAVPFLKDTETGVELGDVWFNGWKHLPSDRLGAKQAEIFSTLIRDRDLDWNRSADGGPLEVLPGALPVYELPGGLRLTLLSPTREKLAKLRPKWEKELKHHGLVPGSKADYRQFLSGTRTTSTDVDRLADQPFRGDATAPNGSSIAVLAEFEGKSALLVGDAHAPVIAQSIETLLAERGEAKLRVDAFKVSHHASKGNISSDLVKLVDSERYLVSTSGARFNHPDREAIARMIKYGGERPQICFNYKSDANEVWAREDLQERYGYAALMPDESSPGLKLTL